jgi:hypothetical protein
MGNATKTRQFCGRQFTPEEMTLVCEVVSTCGGISRRELAYTLFTAFTVSADVSHCWP